MVRLQRGFVQALRCTWGMGTELLRCEWVFEGVGHRIGLEKSSIMVKPAVQDVEHG